MTDTLSFGSMGFDANGHLPVGDHTMTLAALRRSPLVTGPPKAGPAWDEAWRKHLVAQLEILCGHLSEVGIHEVFVDGSFATDKPRPGDIDGYFVCEFDHFLRGQLPQLMALDEAWNLQRRLPDAHGKLKPLMWHKYRVELFPHYLPPFESLAVGITAASGRPILFPDLFRMTREGTPRGIVRIVTPQPP